MQQLIFELLETEYFALWDAHGPPSSGLDAIVWRLNAPVIVNLDSSNGYMITMETHLWVCQWRCSQRALPERKDLPGLWVVHPVAWGTRLSKRRKGADTSIPLALLPDCRFRGTTFPSYATFSPLWLTGTPRLLLKSLLLRCLAMATRKVSGASHCPAQCRWDIL